MNRNKCRFSCLAALTGLLSLSVFLVPARGQNLLTSLTSLLLPPSVLSSSFLSKALAPILTPKAPAQSGGLLGGLLGGLGGLLGGSPTPPPSNTKPLDMKLLILATDGSEPGLAAMQY